MKLLKSLTTGLMTFIAVVVMCLMILFVGGIVIPSLVWMIWSATK